MIRFSRNVVFLLAFATMLLTFRIADSSESDNIIPKQWTANFNLKDCRFASTGRNDYFILEPGYKLFFAGVEDGDSSTLEITVLPDTKIVAGVETRVVEEREYSHGELVEVSRNYFALCTNTASMFYFGEDVDIYENGKIKNHGGSWLAGENNTHAGLVMPGLILYGASFYQEIAPGIAMDRARIVVTDTTLTSPDGRFEHCILIEESTPLEPNSIEYKAYAPGVGLIKDGSLSLVRISGK